MAKTAMTARATHSGGRAELASTMAPPSTSIEKAMPVSMCESGTPAMPSTPPMVMTRGKVTGSDQTLRPPICAPQIPTASIAIK